MSARHFEIVEAANGGWILWKGETDRGLIRLPIGAFTNAGDMLNALGKITAPADAETQQAAEPGGVTYIG